MLPLMLFAAPQPRAIRYSFSMPMPLDFARCCYDEDFRVRARVSRHL